MSFAIVLAPVSQAPPQGCSRRRECRFRTRTRSRAGNACSTRGGRSLAQAAAPATVAVRDAGAYHGCPARAAGHALPVP